MMNRFLERKKLFWLKLSGLALLCLVTVRAEAFYQAAKADELKRQIIEIANSLRSSDWNENAKQTAVLAEQAANFVMLNCGVADACELDEHRENAEDLLYSLRRLALEAQSQENSHYSHSTEVRKMVMSLEKDLGIPLDPTIFKFLYRKSLSKFRMNRVPTLVSLEKDYSVYRRRIKRARFKLDREDPDALEFTIPIWQNLDNGSGRFYTIAGKPMLSSSDLQKIEEQESDFDYDAAAYSELKQTLDYEYESYRFAPAYDLGFEAYLIVNAAQALAESGRLFGCEDLDGQSYQYTEPVCQFLAISRTGRKGDFQISLCSVTGDVERDPPTRCSIIVIYTDRQLWIAVVDEDTRPGSGSDDTEASAVGEYDFSFRVFSNKENFSSIEALANALQSPPWKLNVHSSPSTLNAISPQRYSDVLSSRHDPWHEWIKLWVGEGDCEDSNRSNRWKLNASKCIWFSKSLLVNKQGDDNVDSWHPARSYLEDRWEWALKETYLKALGQLCARTEVVGDRVACFSAP